MTQRHHATHAFALFCLILAVYLSLGGYLQFRYGWWGIMFNQFGILLAPALVYSRFLGMKWDQAFPLETPRWSDFLLTILFTALVIAPIELMIHYQEQILPLPQSIETFYENLMKRPSWYDAIPQFFALGLVPAVCEELFFRGFMLITLEKRFGRHRAILLASLFFAAAHMNPWYLPYYFFLGVYLGYLRHWRENLSLCVLAHLLNNLYSLYG